MSAIPDIGTPSLSTAGFEDGLGRRSVRFDREVGGILECLHLRPELRAFEIILKATSTRVAALGDERFARTFGFEKQPHGLVVLSELPSGERLTDIIDANRGEDAGVSALDAAIGLLLQMVPALAKLHGAGISHGTLAPGRIIVTATAQVVLLDSLYGAAVERLGFGRQTLWTSFGVLAPPAVGAVRLDARTDIAQAALSAAALALGRSISTPTPPDLHQLVGELTDIAQIRAGDRFAEAVRTFFQTTLPRATQSSLSADALTHDVNRLGEFIGVDAALAALADLVRSAPAVEPAAHGSSHDDEDEEIGLEAQRIPAPGPRPMVREAAPLETSSANAAVVTGRKEPDLSEVPPVFEAAAPSPTTTASVAPAAVPDPPPPVSVAPSSEAGASASQMPPSVMPAEFLPVSAPALVDPPTPTELAAIPATPQPTPEALAPQEIPAPPPAPPAPPPLVAPAVQATFEIAASAPSTPPSPSQWTAAAAPAPWPQPSASVPPASPLAAAPAPAASPWAVATPGVPTVFAPPMAPSVTPPPPERPISIAPPLIAPPPPVAAPAPAVQLQAPQKLKLKADGPAGYTPTRAHPAAHPVDRAPAPHSVPFLDRLSSEPEPRAFPWKIVAAAIVVLVVGGFAGRDYLMGRTETAPPPTAPSAAPAKPVTAPTVGALDIVSLPAGARVVLDGDEVGVTPLKLESVQPGRHTVVVSTETASVRRTVRIEAGKTVSLDLSVFAGWVAVFSPIQLHISEDGRALGTTDSGRILLPPGRHVLTLTNTEYGYSAKETVEIVAGEERAVNVTPKGTVNVNAQPWAEVWVDGQRVGETPLANLQVTLGTREFVFKHPQYGERKTVTTVTATPSAVSVDFTRQN